MMTKVHFSLSVQFFNNCLLQILQIIMQFSNNFDTPGQNFNDYRYQKALKQISKLIAVNRQIKYEAQNVKAQHFELSQKFSQLLNQNKFLQLQVQSTRQNIQNLKSNYTNLQIFCEKLQKQNKDSKNMQQKSDYFIRERQQKIRSQLEESKQKWHAQKNQLIKKLQENENTIEHYHGKLQNLLQIQKEVDKLMSQIKNIGEQKQAQRRKTIALGQELLLAQKKMNQNPPEDLIAKLKISEDWIKSLNQQCYELKQKLLEADYQKQKTNYMTNIKNIPGLYIKNQKKTNQNSFRLEQEKQKIRQKYQKVKLKLSKAQLDNQQLRQQNSLLTKKVKGYQKLTQRQQLQIQQLIFSIQSNNSSTDSLFKEEQFKTMIENLKLRNQQLRNQSCEKDNHLKYYEQLIRSINNQKQEFIIIIKDLEKQLEQKSITVNADLSKTYKASSTIPMIKTVPLVKTVSSGPKVFVINGKKYQKYQDKLKDIESVSSLEPQSIILNESPRIFNKNHIFQSGDLTFSDPQRQYHAGSINIKKIK